MNKRSAYNTVYKTAYQSGLVLIGILYEGSMKIITQHIRVSGWIQYYVKLILNPYDQVSKPIWVQDQPDMKLLSPIRYEFSASIS